jgi:hypothetical protein
MGNTDSSNQKAEEFFVNTGNDINNNLIKPAGDTLNPFFNNLGKDFNNIGTTLSPQNSIDNINAIANKMKEPINLVADKLAVKNTKMALDDSLEAMFAKKNFTPITDTTQTLSTAFSKENMNVVNSTLNTAFSKENMNTVNSAFEDNLTKENMLIGAPYAIDSTFLLLNATGPGRIITTGLSMVGVDAATVDKWIGVEPSPVYIVGNAIIDGVFSLLLDPEGGIKGIAAFLQNPSLDTLGKFAGIIPRELGGSYTGIGGEGNTTWWYIEMGAIVVGSVYIYKRINRK